MPLYTPNNQLTLYKGVRLVKDVHQRHFSNRTEQLTYFNTHSKMEITNARMTRDNIMISVPYTQEALRDYNYIMFKNDDFSGKYVFAFITDLIVSATHTTYISYEVDVYQTRLFDMIWQQSMVEREHRQLYDSTGKPIVNTLDEKLAYGSEYDIVHEHSISRDNYVWFVIASTVRLDLESTDPLFQSGTSVQMPSMLNYYVVAGRWLGSNFSDVIINGREISPLHNLFMIMQDADVANSIVSISVTKHLPVGYTTIGSAIQSDSIEVTVTDFEITDEDQPEPTTVSITLARLKRNSGVSQEVYSITGDKYAQFTKHTESKLLMYPYSLIEINDNAGHSMNVRLEHLNSSGLTVTVFSNVGTTIKTALTVSDLNMDGKNKIDSLFNSTVHSIPVKNDNLASFIQSNHNAMKVSNVNNAFTALLGLAGAGIGFSVGGAGGAIMGLSGASQVASGLLNIQSNHAKLQDADNSNPSVSNAGNNADFDYTNGFNGYVVRFKQLKPEYATKLSHFFKLYGYKINELKIPNLKTRSRFNFVKCIEANIRGSMSEPELRELKTMFQNGLTLWHDNNIADYSGTNEVI